MTLLIQVANVDYAHGGNQIFKNTSFVLHEGERAALIGMNGSGKSTLFRLMAREIQPDRGTVTHRRGLSIGYLQQQSALDPHLTVRETMTRAVGDASALDAELHELETRLGEPLDDDTMADVLERYTTVLERLDAVQNADPALELMEVLGGLRFPEHRWDQRVGDLSGGERKLVDVARFLLTQPDVLLLDEPDNHFDVEAKAWLEHWLTTQYAGAVCLISHDRYMIDRVANAIFELEDGQIHQYPGNYSAFLKLKRARLEREAELRDLQEREFKKLKESAEQLTQWARQNDKFAARAENQRRKLAKERERLEATTKPVLHRRTIEVEFDTRRGSTDVLVAENVSKHFGDRTVFRPFDLLLRHGDRAGLIGPNGAGKTTFVRMVLGEEPPTSGTIRLGPSITAGYYAQQQETLDLNVTPLEAVRRVKPLTEQQALSFLVGLHFDRNDTMNRIGSLSGGEQARLQIGMLILSGANLLVLDEPTNNLDIASVEVLESALLKFPGAILAISHDRFFLDRVCTRIIDLRDGGVWDYPGGHSYYVANRDKGTPLTRDLQHRISAPEKGGKKRQHVRR
ncbi:MAG: ATP-binding cassette domain-containing protein [Chloroflexota bacterium]|nr:ATP-binding cassette domain-containing protein [Chloroflexota bacterium]